jgi:hypothetical protein
MLKNTSEQAENFGHELIIDIQRGTILSVRDGRIGNELQIVATSQDE